MGVYVYSVSVYTCMYICMYLCVWKWLPSFQPGYGSSDPRPQIPLQGAQDRSTPLPESQTHERSLITGFSLRPRRLRLVVFGKGLLSSCQEPSCVHKCMLGFSFQVMPLFSSSFLSEAPPLLFQELTPCSLLHGDTPERSVWGLMGV